MLIYLLSSFATALIVAMLVVLVLRARPIADSHRWFAAFASAIAAWIVAITVAHLPTGSALPLRLAFASASLIPPAFLGFVRAFPVPGGWPSFRVVQAVCLLGTVLAALSATTPLVVYDVTLREKSLHRGAGPLFPVFATYFVATFGAALALLTARWRRATGLARRQLAWVGLGVALSGFAATTTNLLIPWLVGTSALSWVGPYFAVLLVGIVAHAVIRHRLMQLRLAGSRRATRVLAAGAALTPVAVAIGAFLFREPREGAPDETGLFLVAVGSAVMVFRLRAWTAKLIDRYLGRVHVSFRSTMREASDLLTRGHDLRRVLEAMSELIARSLGANGVAIYAASPAGFSRAASVRRGDDTQFEAPDVPPHPVTDALVARRRPLGTGIHSDDPELLAHLRALDWAVVLLLRAEGAPVGLVAIGPKRSGDPFDARELDLLGTLANQAGIAIKNGELYGQVVLAREYIETVLATIESGVVAVDGTGRPVMVNRAAARLAGLRTGDAADGPGDALPAPLAALLRDTLADGRGRTVPELVLAPERADDPVLCVTSPLRAPSGAPAGAVAVLSDLGPLRALERERRRAERLAYFEALAAALAHEIKNPLVGIKTFAQLMPRRHHDPQFLAEFSRVVAGQVQRMERLLTRLQRLSRPSRRPRERVDLRAVVLGAVALVQPAFEDKRVRLVVETGAEPGPVAGDPAELEELFVNLLTNAREATPPGGAVSIAITAADGRVTVTVADTGPGIAPAHLEHVFDPFFTTRPGGSGLGLAIAASIAESHGARLHVANRSSGGALVTFDVPTAPPVEALACR